MELIMAEHRKTAGKTLPEIHRDRLQCAKTELRRQFGKDQGPVIPGRERSERARNP
jgi:hypothetical protein